MFSTRREVHSSQGMGGVLSASLFVLAFAKGRGIVDASVELGLSALVFLVGAGWVLRGDARLERASELYLWLAFIVSINHLQVLSNALAAWIGLDSFTVFQAAALIHVVVVIGSLGVLGAWSERADRRSQAAGVAAGLFVVGAVVFWVGARTFPGTALSQVHTNTAGHIFTSLSFLVSTLVTLAGLALLTLAMREAGDRVLSLLGLMAFGFGAVFWTLHLIFRLTVVVHAAQEWGETSIAPAWFEPWRLWAAWLFAIYSVLAYVGLAAYGSALLKIGWLSRWVGWSCVLAGFAAAALGGLPLFIHVPLWIVGILLLRDARRPVGAVTA